MDVWYLWFVLVGQMPTTTTCEDIISSISQAKEVNIKRDRKNEILSKLFFTHDLQKNGDKDIQQIISSNNLADLFTKALPTTTFEKSIKVRWLIYLN